MKYAGLNGGWLKIRLPEMLTVRPIIGKIIAQLNHFRFRETNPVFFGLLMQRRKGD
jgi:hypothetical protein